MVFVLGLALFPRTSPAAPVAPRQHLERAWDMQDGLPDNSVNVILQTSDGYLWLGTDRGLVRFDGVDFDVFNTWNTPALHSDRISALCEDAPGSLWIGTKGGGVTHHRDGGFMHVGLSSQFINALCADGRGRVWVGTSGGGLFALRAGNFTAYSASRGLPDLFVLAICERRDGTILVGTRSAGLVRLNGEGFEPVPLPGLPRTAPIHALHEDARGRRWLGTAAGLIRVDDRQVRRFTRADGLPAESVRALAEDAQGRLWVGTEAGAVALVFAPDADCSIGPTRLPGERIHACTVDREGNVWLGPQGRGLRQLALMKFAALTARDGLNHEVVNCGLEDRTGAIWLGTSGGLNRLADGALTGWTTTDGLAHLIVTALAEDASGALWIGTQAGMNRLEAGRLHRCSAAEGWPQVSVWAFLEDADGTLWMGTADGLFERRDGRIVRHTIDDGLPSNDVRALAAGREGRIWIGTAHGLARREQGRFARVALPEDLLARIVLCLHEDAEGRLWCGTLGGGLIRLEAGHATVFTRREGFPDNTIYQILEDDLGSLWLTSNRGVFRVRKEALNRLARGEVRSVEPRLYGRADGLPSEQCQGFSQPAGWKTRDGRLWFPTARGVGVIAPAHASASPAAPPVVLEAVVADNERLPAGDVVRVPPGRERLEFHFVGLSFTMPERVKFRYRLEGFDKDWTEAGSRRVAYYTKIPPARYRFRVTAAIGAGGWGEHGVAATVVVRPYLWQTGWFRLGAALTVVVTILGVHRWRVARVRALERLRLRIARDLHDEVGSNLSSILLLTQVAPQPAPAELSDIRRVASETIDALRDIVWLINPAHDKLGDLVQRMQETARTMLPGIAHEFRHGPLPAHQELPLAFRQNVLPIFKEILNNAVHHARADKLDIAVRVTGGQFELRVGDDGVGFDPASVRLGNGLRNFRRRADELGGALIVDSAPGQGTTITLKAPLA